MSLRFRKSIKIAPGVKVNLNKNSVSTTIGTKGAHYTANSKGVKTVSAGIPGTGLSYTASSGKSRKSKQARTIARNSYSSANDQPDTKKKAPKKKHGCLVPIIIFFAALFLLDSCLSDDELNSIALSADTETVYDINAEIPINLTTEPDKYSIPEGSFDISGGTLDISDKEITFSATEEGSYTICANHSGVKSNTLIINVEDKEAIAKEEEKKKEEAAAQAAAKVKEEEDTSKTEELGATGTNNDEETDSQNNFDTYDNPEQQHTKNNYVLNTSTMKFHLPSCRDVPKIAPQNYSTYDGTRDDIINQGYSSCGHCKP